MREKIKGCFLGLATGDALGVPVEFRRRAFLESSPVTTMTGFGVWNQPPGTWSDDSSLTFCTAESLALKGYDLNDMATRFGRWYKEGYWGARHELFDIGGTTRVALTRFLEGEDPKFSGEFSADANGNGSLMRIAPAAIYFRDLGVDEFYDAIREISSITHAHFRSIFSCFVFSKFLTELLKTDDKMLAYRSMIKTTSQFAHSREFNSGEILLFKRILDGSLVSCSEETIESQGYVLHTLEASIWCFMNTTNFNDAVLKAVNLGGDTDTTGCVTGALAGLYYGDQAIPMHWREVLAREKDIIKLAEDFSDSIL